MPQKKSEELNYETAMNRISQIAAEMEKPDLPLEKSAELFEEAVALISFCSEKLKEIELKIKTVDRDM